MQLDMFTGEPVDNRSKKQKRLDAKREKPKQAEMFSAREVAQFGVKANPLISLSPHMALPLEAEDPRTEEEKEADKQKRIRELTYELPTLEEPMDPWDCPNCGETNSGDAEECKWCGYEPDEFGYVADNFIDDVSDWIYGDGFEDEMKMDAMPDSDVWDGAV